MVTSNLSERIGITDVNALTLWIRSRCAGHYSVRFEHGAETAYVQRKPSPMVVIPLPNAKMTLRDAIRLRGFSIHESGHPRHHPEIFDILDDNPIPQGSPLGAVFNAILDVHNETCSYREFPGDGKALSEFAAVVGRDVYEKLSKSFKDAGSVWPPNFTKMAGVMIACRNAEKSWNVGMDIGFAKLVDELYSQEMRDLADAIEDKFHLTERLVENCHNEDGHSIFELAKEIFEFVWGKPADDEIQKKPKDKGEGKGEPQSSAPGSPGEGEGKDAGSDSGEQGKGDGEESLAEQCAKEKIKIDELLFSDHYETIQGGGSGMGFDYSAYKEWNTYSPVDPASFKVIEYGKK